MVTLPGRPVRHVFSNELGPTQSAMTSNPSVLMVAMTFLPVVGGLQFELKWFLDSLDRRGGEIGVDFHFAYPNEASRAFTRFRNIPVHDLRIGGRGIVRTVRLIARLGHLLRRIRPDIVHCHALTPDAYCVLAACWVAGVRARVVATSHGHDIVWLPNIPYGSLGSWRARFLARAITGRLAAHVTVSRAMATNAASAGTAPDRIRVIHNGVPGADEDDFETNPSTALPSRSPTIHRPNDGINILSLSSAREVKNVATLIDAMAIARDKLGDSRLYLTCSGRPAEPLKRLVRRKGLDDVVAFVGIVTGANKQACFRACDVFCLSSHFEAFGLVALEAMRYGTAVVATREGGVGDFLEHEVNGLMFSPDDPVALASALVRLHREPALRERLARKGRQTVARFSIASVVDQHIRLYRELAV